MGHFSFSEVNKDTSNYCCIICEQLEIKKMLVSDRCYVTRRWSLSCCLTATIVWPAMSGPPRTAKCATIAVGAER